MKICDNREKKHKTEGNVPNKPEFYWGKSSKR
jgi:hypothetical protein